MDVAAALRSLELSREDDVADLTWLADSYRDPAPFWADLIAHANQSVRLASRPGVACALYEDAVARHAAGGAIARTALTAFDRRLGWSSLSYTELDARATGTAADWASRGTKAGDVVALVLPVGAAWLVSFAAALRLGLIVSFLEPAGDLALGARLDALAPSFIVFDAADPPILGRWAEKAIAAGSDTPSRAPRPPPAHVYAPDAPCARLFSPLRAPLTKPIDLPAEAAWRSALRDATFVYRLGSGDGLALPGFPQQQHQPAAILAALIAGATFVHADVTDVEARPALLTEKPIATLGVSPAVRDVLRRSPVLASSPSKQWIRSVDEPLDWASWKDFVTRNDLARTPIANVLVDAAAGGAVLFSARRPGSPNAYVLPAAGTPYGLFDVASGQPALGGVGVFVPSGGDPAKDGWFLLVRRGDENLWASTRTPRRAGRVFPASEVEPFAGGEPGARGAAVAPVPTGDPPGRWAFVLLVFAGDATVDGAAIDAAIRARWSEAHLPDTVSVVPLLPRIEGGKVDADWCRRQYSSGLLAKKAAHPAFRALTSLRETLGA